MGNFSTTPDYMLNCDSGSIKMPSMHYHASYELYYLQTGNRDYFIEDKLFPVSAGDFVLIPPGKLHRTDLNWLHHGFFVNSLYPGRH